MRDKKIAEATHNISAYRIRDGAAMVMPCPLKEDGSIVAGSTRRRHAKTRERARERAVRECVSTCCVR